MGLSFGVAFGLGVVLALGLATAFALPLGVLGAEVGPFDFADFVDFFVFPSSSLALSTFDFVFVDGFLIGVIEFPLVELFLGFVTPAFSNLAFFFGRSSSDSMADKLEPSSMPNVDGLMGLLTLGFDLASFTSFSDLPILAVPVFAFFSFAAVDWVSSFDGLSFGLAAPTGSRPFLLRPR